MTISFSPLYNYSFLNISSAPVINRKLDSSGDGSLFPEKLKMDISQLGCLLWGIKNFNLKYNVNLQLGDESYIGVGTKVISGSGINLEKKMSSIENYGILQNRGIEIPLTNSTGLIYPLNLQVFWGVDLFEITTEKAIPGQFVTFGTTGPIYCSSYTGIGPTTFPLDQLGTVKFWDKEPLKLYRCDPLGDEGLSIELDIQPKEYES